MTSSTPSPRRMPAKTGTTPASAAPPVEPAPAPVLDAPQLPAVEPPAITRVDVVVPDGHVHVRGGRLFRSADAVRLGLTPAAEPPAATDA